MIDDRYDLVVFDGQVFVDCWQDTHLRKLESDSLRELKQRYCQAGIIVLVDQFSGQGSRRDYFFDPGRRGLLALAAEIGFEVVMVRGGVRQSAAPAFLDAAREAGLSAIFVSSSGSTREFETSCSVASDRELARLMVERLGELPSSKCLTRS